MTYYKATKPDGTDFHTGTILYEVGKKVRPAKYSGARKICGPGVLHASDEPGETLIGGSWPCRLFIVEGKSRYERGHKHGFHQLNVIEEIEAWKALGPNGVDVVALIERVKRLTYEEAKALGTARDTAWYAARDTAREAAWDAARGAAWDTAWYAARDAARDTARDAARDTARDAAFALVVRDLISPEHFNTLYGPWAQVIGDK